MPESTDPEAYLGFDATLEDTSVVVMRRSAHGGWVIDQADGPDADLMAALVASYAAAPARTLPPPGRPISELAAEWMTDQRRFELTAEQRHFLNEIYGRCVREGKLSYATTAFRAPKTPAPDPARERADLEAASAARPAPPIPVP